MLFKHTRVVKFFSPRQYLYVQRFDWEKVAPARNRTLAKINSKANFNENHQRTGNNAEVGSPNKTAKLMDDALAICTERSRSNVSMILSRGSLGPSSPLPSSSSSGKTRFNRSVEFDVTLIIASIYITRQFLH